MAVKFWTTQSFFKKLERAMGAGGADLGALLDLLDPKRHRLMYFWTKGIVPVAGNLSYNETYESFTIECAHKIAFASAWAGQNGHVDAFCQGMRWRAMSGAGAHGFQTAAGAVLQFLLDQDDTKKTAERDWSLVCGLYKDLFHEHRRTKKHLDILHSEFSRFAVDFGKKASLKKDWSSVGLILGGVEDVMKESSARERKGMDAIDKGRMKTTRKEGIKGEIFWASVVHGGGGVDYTTMAQHLTPDDALDVLLSAAASSHQHPAFGQHLSRAMDAIWGLRDPIDFVLAAKSYPLVRQEPVVRMILKASSGRWTREHLERIENDKVEQMSYIIKDMMLADPSFVNIKLNREIERTPSVEQKIGRKTKKM